MKHYIDISLIDKAPYQVWRVNMSDSFYQFLFITEDTIQTAFNVQKGYPSQTRAPYFILKASPKAYFDAILWTPEFIGLVDTLKFDSTSPKGIYNTLSWLIDLDPVIEGGYTIVQKVLFNETYGQVGQSAETYQVFALNYGNDAWDVALTQDGIVKFYFNIQHDGKMEVTADTAFNGLSLKTIAQEHWHAYRLIEDAWSVEPIDMEHWFDIRMWEAKFADRFNSSLSDFNKLPEAVNIL